LNGLAVRFKIGLGISDLNIETIKKREGGSKCK